MGAPNITLDTIESKESKISYFRAMERLLYNYTKLKAQVADVEEYMQVELHEKSKDVLRFFSSGGGSQKDREDVLFEIERNRAISYIRTKARFDELDRVVHLFKDRQEFPVIRMYYFNEEPPRDGEKEWSQRPDYAPRYTWDDIADHLGVNKNTPSRWRKEIVRDMMVSMFGTPAAIEAYTWQGREKKGE